MLSLRFGLPQSRSPIGLDLRSLVDFEHRSVQAVKQVLDSALESGAGEWPPLIDSPGSNHSEYLEPQKVDSPSAVAAEALWMSDNGSSWWRWRMERM